MSALSAIAEPPPRPYKDYPHLRDLRDEQLLTRFFKLKEESAFAVLVARYGSLVYGVCHRVLGNASDAEDAFQATFMVLVKKGATLRQPGRLANWLYGVAYRTACKVKSQAAQRTRLEREASEMPGKSSPISGKSDMGDMTYEQLWKVLDEEINQLPPKYALPLVLCYLEGKSNAEAAAQLGWPEGSMSRRLSRARDLLRGRLSKRGMAMTAVLLASVFARPAVACAPAHLVASTAHAGSMVAQGMALKDVLSPLVAKVTEEVVRGFAFTYKLVASMSVAAASLLVASSVVVWQMESPGFSLDVFGYRKPPMIWPDHVRSPGLGTSISISVEVPTPSTEPVKQNRQSDTQPAAGPSSPASGKNAAGAKP